MSYSHINTVVKVAETGTPTGMLESEMLCCSALILINTHPKLNMHK